MMFNLKAITLFALWLVPLYAQGVSKAEEQIGHMSGEFHPGIQALITYFTSDHVKVSLLRVISIVIAVVCQIQSAQIRYGPLCQLGFWA